MVDAAGNMTVISENGGLVLASFGYDDLGRRTALTRGNGTTSSYSYDAAGRLASLSLDLGGSAYDVSTTFGYNPAGQIASSTRSNDAYAWTGHYNVDQPYGVNEPIDAIVVVGELQPVPGAELLRNLGECLSEVRAPARAASRSAWGGALPDVLVR